MRPQLHDALQRKEEAFRALQERNVHLRQLAERAKHLASVLEVSDGAEGGRQGRETVKP